MNPLVSIIIPVGGAHQQLVRSAVASCIWQTMPYWEAIVINDGKNDIPSFGDSRVRVIDSPNRGLEKGKHRGNRAAVARNAGIKVARGEYIVCLDADDYLLREGLAILLYGQSTHDASYTYSSHYSHGQHMRPPDYDQQKYAVFNLHPITALIRRDDVLQVGGFDENAPGWEDWTLYLRLAIAGKCGEYFRGPVFVYQDMHSINHVVDIAGGQDLMDQVTAPYKTKGVIHMAACCGSGARATLQNQVSSMGIGPQSSEGYVILEYTGPLSGSFIIRHPVSKRTYRSGRNPSVRFVQMPVEDSAHFMELYPFRLVPQVPALEDAPAPVPILDVEIISTSETTVIETETLKSTEKAPAVDDFVDVKVTARKGRPPRE